MPFRHVALFRWAEHVEADHVERVRDAYDQLADQVSGMRHHAHGADVGVSEGTFDYVVVADFDDVGAWRAYRDHPSHVVLVEELIVDHVAERAGAQFVVADDAGPVGVLGAPTGVPTGVRPGDADPTAAAEETDDELMARARRAAMAEMQALLAEPDDAPDVRLD